MEDNNELPGPGSYTGLYSNSSFSSLKKERFQKMKMGVPRWQIKQYNPNLFQEQYVGPGYYENN